MHHMMRVILIRILMLRMDLIRLLLVLKLNYQCKLDQINDLRMHLGRLLPSMLKSKSTLQHWGKITLSLNRLRVVDKPLILCQK